MLKKLLIVYAFLFSYSGAMAHSIVPHHHHNSEKEAKQQHRHHDQTNHSHGEDDSSKKGENNQDGTYFLTHASNTDVVVSHFSFDNPVKGKKIQFSVPFFEPLVSFRLSDHNIFHPPSNEWHSSIVVFNSRSLRAPPFFVI